MSQDINNIDTYETRTKFNATKWTPIYEVIDEAYIKESNIFVEDLSDNVKKHSNVELDIPHEVKNNIKRMAMEQILYAQVVNLRCKGLKFVATDNNQNGAKFKFQGQSARSQIWFDIDLDWIEINFSSREPDFYKKLFQIHDDTQDINTFKTFQVPIVNAKRVESFKFKNDAPVLKYCQKTLNICFSSSLASDFASINHLYAANNI